MEEKDIIANNLVNYRKKAGISQLELAKKLQYSNKNIPSGLGWGECGANNHSP